MTDPTKPKWRSHAAVPGATDAIQMAGPWITDFEVQVVTEVMRNGWYDYAYCERFEREFADWHGRAHALMTPNCTTALHLLLAALEVGPGDEVLVPDCTWIGSTAAITYVGATPVFCDIDPADWCLCPRSAAAAITERTKAMIAVDLFGNMPQMDALRALCKAHDLHLIEDAAEALGSVYKGTRAGKFGAASVFSFHRTKTLATGEGGMLLVDDPALLDRCHFLRDHGRSRSVAYAIEEVAFKYMPFNLQAAVGWAQLQRVDELIERKRWMLARYREQLAHIPDLQLNPEPPGGVNGAWCSTLVFGPSHGVHKLQIMEALAAQGLPNRPFFYPLSSQPCYDQSAAYEARNPVAYDLSARGINLPGAFTLTEAQIDTYCRGVETALETVKRGA
jgi:perosamine synthetase